MYFRLSVGILFSALGIASASIARAEDLCGSKPNVLLIITDDQGVWDTGVSGNPHIDTPHMDRLAREGVRFSRFYAAPVCAPTRAGLMTGRYYLRTGLYNTRFGGDTLGIGEITVAQLLKKAGYRTGLFGKWHLGKYYGYQPDQRGFDRFLGHYHGHMERYEFPDQIVENGRPVEARGYVSDLFTDAAGDFIAESGKDPFFCVLAFNAPHSPWILDTSHYGQPEGDKILEKYLGRGLPLREARIYSLVDRVDVNIGRILARLEELDLQEDTVVLFMSDNGGVSKFFKAGIRGNKAQVYEGGVRSPLFVRWPGKFPAGGVVSGQAWHVDIMPTLCELAGVDLPTDREFDGVSLLSLLVAGKGKKHHDYVYHTWDRYVPNPDNRWSISDQRYKLLGQVGTGGTPDPAKWMLFDLEKDSSEETNIAKKNPETVQRLREEFLRWFKEVTQGVEYRPIAVPVGHPEENPVEIQASWATWHGDAIEYNFQGYDWDTIEGWKSPGERAEWNLDVRGGGEYEILIRYGCRFSDAGGLLRISADGNFVEHRVRATATPEVFRRQKVGTLQLAEGRVLLVAEAVEVPGDELMRLNGIWLRKVDSTGGK